MIVKPNWKWEEESVEILARGRDSVLVDVKNNFPIIAPFSLPFLSVFCSFGCTKCVCVSGGGVARFNLLFYLLCLASIKIINLLLESTSVSDIVSGLRISRSKPVIVDDVTCGKTTRKSFQEILRVYVQLLSVQRKPPEES